MALRRAACTQQLRSLVASQAHRSLQSVGCRWRASACLQDNKRSLPLATTHRCLSATAQTSTADNANKKGDSKKKDDSNFFLDNIGGIFLSAIGLVIVSLVRSSYGTKNRHKIRDALEESSALDPLEIDDLRLANSELTPQVFRTIMSEAQQEFPEGVATYQDFVKCVRRTMCQMKGSAFTIELGHLVDRAVVAAFEQQRKQQDEPVSLVFLLAAMSLALHSSSPDRIKILYEVMQQQHAEGDRVVFQDVLEMIGYLQDTCQLVPLAQVVESTQKFPTQQYHRGTPTELVQWNGSNTDAMDVDAFADILRSKAVCAWGECHSRKKGL